MIMDGRVPHSLLIELFTEHGMGTIITAGQTHILLRVIMMATIPAFPTETIGDWVFDLDNTIYPAKTNLFRMSVRITELGRATHNVPHDARVIQKDLFHRYGTTMRGMMSEENIDPDVYLDYVHDIDVSDLSHDTELTV